MPSLLKLCHSFAANTGTAESLFFLRKILEHCPAGRTAREVLPPETFNKEDSLSGHASIWLALREAQVAAETGDARQAELFNQLSGNQGAPANFTSGNLWDWYERYQASGRPRAALIFHSGLLCNYTVPEVRALLAQQVASAHCVVFRVPSAYHQDETDGRTRLLTKEDWQYRLDTVGQQIAIQDALGRRMTTTYNAVNLPIGWRDALGVLTTLARDEINRERQYYYANGTITTIGHTRATNYPLSIQQPTGQRTSYIPADEFRRLPPERVYANADIVLPLLDADYNIAQLLYSGGRRVTSTYDPLDQITKMVDWSGTMAYDALGQLKSLADPLTGALTYSYDANGNKLQVAYPGGALTYSWDSNGRLAQIGAPGGLLATLSYDALNRSIWESLGGRGRSRSFDAVGNPLTERTLSSTGALLAGATATYDAVGNRLGSVELDGSRTSYSYDANNQLTKEQRSGTNPYDIQYSYDVMGNRLTQVRDGAISSFSYLPGNLLQAITAPDGSKTSYTYDLNGNRHTQQSAAGVTTYLWQVENVLAGVQLPDGTLTTNLYAPDGMRRKTSTGTQSTVFVWDGANILRDLNTDDTQQALYIGPPDDLRYLIGMQRGSDSYLAGLDVQGSVNRLVDASNAITDSYLTTAFGEEIASTGTTINPFQFEGLFGYHRESVNRHLVRYRDLDTATGGFLKLDPMVFYGGEVNWYDYVGNNPVNWVDPLGLSQDMGGGSGTVRFSIATFIPQARVNAPLGGVFGGDARGFSYDSAKFRTEINGVINLRRL